MRETPQEKLRYLSDLIEQEKSDAFDALVVSFAAQLQGKRDDYDGFSQTRKEKLALLTLRAMRIHAVLECKRTGLDADNEMLLSDWDDILDCVRHLSYEYEVTRDTVSDAFDLVLLYNPDARKTILRSLNLSATQFVDNPPRKDELFRMAEAMLDYGFLHDFNAESFALLKNLVHLSEARKGHEIDEHRRLVVSLMEYIADYNRPLCAQIALEQAVYYQQTTDETAALFYWYGGYALSLSGNTGEGNIFLNRCKEISYLLEGNRSWFAARAALFYHLNQIDVRWNAESERFIRNFLKNCEEGFYINVQDSAPFLEAYARYVLLSRSLEYGSLRGLLPEIEKYYAYCKENEALVKNPYLTVRAAENVLSGYYFELGDNLLAAQHGERALAAEPIEGVEQYPSDDIIYSNLLNIYSQLNDVDKMDHMVEHMAKKTNAFSNPEAFQGSRDEFYRLGVITMSAASKLGISESEYLNDFRQSLSDFYNEMSYHTNRWRAERKTDVGYGLYLLTCMLGVLDSFSSNKAELHRFLSVVEHLLQNQDVYAFRDVQKAIAYMMKADVLWHLGDSRAVQAAQQCLKYSGAFDASQEALISAQRLCAVIFYNSGRPDLARIVSFETLHNITASWHKAVAYLNDHRVSQVLGNIQFYFDVCYSILKQESGIQERYQQVLQFKNLPALVGRERNRILRLAPADEKLIRKIYRLQDQLATVQIEDAINATSHSAEIQSELQSLEAEFASSFPQNARFTEISIGRIAGQLRDHEAILEYYFSYGKKALNGKPCTSEQLELETFIITKECGKAQIHYCNYTNGSEILEAAEALIECYQNQTDSRNENGEATRLNANLYRWLIKPVRSYIQAVRKLYLAPDLSLCSLPIENLFADGNERFFEEHKICRIVCGRDLLFYQDSPFTGGSLVLGDPAYDYDRERGADPERWADPGDEAEPLPFSKLEAYTVGRLCGCAPLTGTNATKYALKDHLPCRIIHLATHGTVDKEMTSDSMYSSALLFAGYNDWIASGTEKKLTGNGILTADEISRMDLRQTELVVLSACDSGLGDTMFGGTQGLVSAFSAAGVKWVICHLWSAHDCATAILMGTFYQRYLVQHRSVPDALQEAKSFLQNASIEQLRQQEWLKIPRGVYLAPDVLEFFEELKHANPRKKLFNSEFKWGGFVCYQCR